MACDVAAGNRRSRMNGRRKRGSLLPALLILAALCGAADESLYFTFGDRILGRTMCLADLFYGRKAQELPEREDAT